MGPEGYPPELAGRGRGRGDDGSGRASRGSRDRRSGSREPEKPKGKMGLRVRVVGSTPLSKIRAGDVLSQLEANLRDAAEEAPSLTIPKDKTVWRFLEGAGPDRRTGREPTFGRRDVDPWPGPGDGFDLGPEGRPDARARTDDVPRDPLTGEDVSNDVRWELIFLVRIEDDGVPDTGDEATSQQAEATGQRGRRSGA
jgi:hypothetical protein